MALAMQVLQRLAATRAAEQAEPCFVSGAVLAADFKVTRSAIWKAIGQLRELGTQIDAITHYGYRLVLPTSPLDAAGVIAQLQPQTRQRLREGHCEASIDSTNAALLDRGAPPPGQFDFLTAEYQSAGRGRRGRSWLAPPGGAVCLSWSWCFEALPSQPGALSLVIGVAAIRALAGLGLPGVQLKWPNDLVLPAGKLGGILIEMRSEAAGPMHAVVGMGLNVALGPDMRASIDAHGNVPVDLAEQFPGSLVPRNHLVAAILDHGISAMSAFSRQGFAPFRADYLTHDWLGGKAVALSGGNGPATGIARGVDDDGALLVEHDGGISRIISGEVSVRTKTP